MGKFREITGAKKQKQGIREATGAQLAAGERAADVSLRGMRRGITAQEEALADVTGTLQPFASAGEQAIGGIFDVISPQRDFQLQTDPQRYFQLQTDPSRVLENPFFQALAAEQEQRLMASQAARGKVGAGETTDLLQRNLLQLGSQFQQQDIANQLAEAQAQATLEQQDITNQLAEAQTQATLEQQRFGQMFNVGQLGFGAAGQTAGAQQTTGANISNFFGQQAVQEANIITGMGNVEAAGITGAAQTQAASQAALANLALQAGTGGMAGGMGLLGSVGGTKIGAGGGALLGVLCDETQKDIIKPVKVDDDGLTVYEFTYKHDPAHVYRGKMAQDILKIDPDHVFERNGVLMVTEKYKPEVVKHGA